MPWHCEGVCTSGTMGGALVRGSPRDIKWGERVQKPLIFMHFHAVSLGKQHEIWSKQHNGKVKDVEYRLAHLRPRMSEFSRWQLETRKICIEYEIEKWKYTAEVIEFEEAFASAGQTLAPYYEAYENLGLIILDDLKEINLEKSRRRAFLKLDNPQRR